MDDYLRNAIDVSKKTTINYSTSFSYGIKLLSKENRDAIFSIYGYVRFADEIVDTFFDQNQKALLDTFRKDTYDSIKNEFSINPILHSFQWVVRKYKIGNELIDAFLDSMEMDLNMSEHNDNSFEAYVFGSAEAVGLMCLKVFCPDPAKYDALVHPARKLGSAFQKVNFLRDIKDDFLNRGRSYFPDVDLEAFDETTKQKLVADIKEDFAEAQKGIINLPREARIGVYIAYIYYLNLTKKIGRTSAKKLLKQRIRISNKKKIRLLLVAILKLGFTRKEVLFT